MKAFALRIVGVCELQLVGQGMEGGAFMLGTIKDGRNYLCYAHASRIVAATALRGAGRIAIEYIGRPPPMQLLLLML